MTSTASIAKGSLASLLCLFLLLAPAAQTALADPQQEAAGSQHVVSSADLERDLVAAVAKRRTDAATVENFFSTASARRALKNAGLNYKVVRQAVPLLTNRELSNLAARADRAQKRFEAGALTNQQITYIIIALATAVIVIIIVAH